MTLYYSDMKHYCFLVLILSVYVYDTHCYSTSGPGNWREILIDCFQKALMNDSEQLFMLQKAFLLPQQIGGKCLTIHIFIEGRIDITIYNPEYYCDGYYLNESDSCIIEMTKYFELSPTPVTTLVEFLGSNFTVQALAAMDPSFHTLITVISNEFVTDYSYDAYDYFDPSPYSSYDIYMTCTVGNIDPSEFQIIYNDVTDAVYVTLSWAKAYIESPKLKKLENITWIKDVYECLQTSSSHPDRKFFSSSVTAKLIFCTYLFLNILILLFTVLFFGKVFSWIIQPKHKKLKELFKASAIVLTIVNFSTLFNDVLAHTLYGLSYTQDSYDPIPLNAIDYGIYLVLKIVLVFLIFIFDITVSCFNTCKFRRGCSSAMYALAFCQIIWFVHRLATDIIIFVIAFTVAPAQALGMITLIISTIVCAILFVSLLLKKCQAGCNCRNYTCNRNTFPTICCTFLVAICTVGLIFTVTLLFIALVDNGLQSAGVGGFILSLVPPTAVFVIGLCINHEFAINFYRNVLTSNGPGMNRSATLSEEDAPTDEDVNIQTNKYTQLVQTSVAIDMEGHEKFEEEPYRPAQKIGL